MTVGQRKDRKIQRKQCEVGREFRFTQQPGAWLCQDPAARHRSDADEQVQPQYRRSYRTPVLGITYDLDRRPRKERDNGEFNPGYQGD